MPIPAASPRAATLAEAYKAAFDCDSVSAFGGIIALNRPLDGATAEAISAIFTEVVAAPDADEEALAIFARKKNLRLILTGALRRSGAGRDDAEVDRRRRPRPVARQWPDRRAMT